MPTHEASQHVLTAAAEPEDLIVTAWQAGHLSYVEALRRLLDFGVPVSAAIRGLAATGQTHRG